MAHFVRKPFYTLRDLVNLFNEFEKERPAGERETWSRWRVRTVLKNRGILAQGAGRGVKVIVTYEQLADLRRSMQMIDAEDEAARLSA